MKPLAGNRGERVDEVHGGSDGTNGGVQDRDFGTVTRGELVRLGGALLLGAALAFPAASWIAGPRETAAPRPRPPGAERRAMFSPDVRGDPYMLDQLQQQVEALEAHCRRAGEMCAEARGARARYEDLAARP